MSFWREISPIVQWSKYFSAAAAGRWVFLKGEGTRTVLIIQLFAKKFNLESNVETKIHEIDLKLCVKIE